MKIGIIGAGNMGSVVVRKLTQLGHEVAVANSRGPETLSGLAEETGAKASTIEGVVRGSEIVIIISENIKVVSTSYKARSGA